MIVAKDLSLRISNKNILKNVSIDIEPEKITTIIGQNGAGKSSLLKCITGITKSDSGFVEIDNKKIEEYSIEELAQRRAVLSQSNPISFPFTALEIALMGRNPYLIKNEQSEDFKIVENAMKDFEVWHLKDQLFSTLSGGEQQRVHLARVVVQISTKGNFYLFLDEPISALDLKHQHKSLELISKIALKKNIAVCLIIHDLHLAKLYSDKIILMKNGEVFLSGKADEILTKENISNAFEIKEELVFI